MTGETRGTASDPERARGRKWQLCALLAVPYAISVLIATTVRIDVATPWELVLAFASVGVAYAYCLIRGFFLLQGYFRRRTTRGAEPNPSRS